VAWSRDADQDGCGEVVNQGSSASPVEVAHAVAEVRGHVEKVGDAGRGAFGCGLEAQLAAVGVNVPGLVVVSQSVSNKLDRECPQFRNPYFEVADRQCQQYATYVDGHEKVPWREVTIRPYVQHSTQLVG